MKIKKIISCLFALGILTSCNTTAPTMASFHGDQYRVSLLLPPQWKEYSSEADVTGNFRIYRPISTSIRVYQFVGMSYDDSGASLKDAMARLVTLNTSPKCESTVTKVLAQQADSITFSTIKVNCEDSSSAFSSVHKIFKMHDGNYSITYAANPKVIKPEQMQRLQQVVIDAQLQSLAN